MKYKKREKHEDGKTRLYKTWGNMKQRCTNSAYRHYYSGRGIGICEEWSNSYLAFRNWALLNGYADHLSIDRIDNDGNYEPSNCRWATRSQQIANTRKRSDGETSCYKGVYWEKRRCTWTARIGRKWIGSFSSEIDAAIAYDDAAVLFYGEFAKVNFPERQSSITGAGGK